MFFSVIFVKVSNSAARINSRLHLTGSDLLVTDGPLSCFLLLQHQNFEESQEAMKQQLLQLSILLKALDPELCDFLG